MEFEEERYDSQDRRTGSECSAAAHEGRSEAPSLSRQSYTKPVRSGISESKEIMSAGRYEPSASLL